MNKYVLMAFGAALIVASSCTAISEIENPEHDIMVEEVVITATHEYDPGTKTVLKNDGSVWWKPNDAIGVFFGTHISKFHAYNMEDSPSANFIGNALIIQGHNENSDGNASIPSYWGVFPPELSNSYTSDENFNYERGNEDYEIPSRENESVNVHLPARQKGVAGTFDSNNFISIAKSNDYKNFTFYNLCGGLAFTVEHEGINKVTFAGNSGEILAGKVNVVMNSTGRPVINEIINGKTEVTLALKKSECFIPGEWYYIVMLPTALENGYTMTFCTDYKKATLVSSKPVQIKRSVFGRLENADSDLEFNYSPAYTIEDIYSMFSEPVESCEYFYGSNSIYIKYLMLMSELRGDNVTLSGRTTDPLYDDIIYSDTPESYDVTYFWETSYRIIEGCNQNIETLKVGESSETDHILGECYFLRALSHFNLLNLYATPYNRGKGMPGVILRTSTSYTSPERSRVSAVYDQIVADLELASEMMKNGTRRGDAGFVSYDAARALLTRVYLYSGYYNDCIAVASNMLGDDALSHLDDITTYFPNTRTSKETLWCVVKTAADKNYSPKSQLASMYYTSDQIGGTGWCEMYWSDPLMELIFRHPEDKRLTYWGTITATNDGTVMIHWPTNEWSDQYRMNNIVFKIEGFDKGAAENKITYNGKTYTVKRTTERTGYPEYYVENLLTVSDDNDGFLGPKHTQVYVRDNVTLAKGVRHTFPAYTMSKFSWQDGDPMLASPAIIRWAEVILNLAEAYAHVGDEVNALKYVNIIRERAGIPQWTGREMYEAEGYTNILDVVLDERRLELCFEGHRAIDLYRNDKSIDRRFSGVHPWEVLEPNRLDEVYPYCIPYYVVESEGVVGNGKN